MHYQINRRPASRTFRMAGGWIESKSQVIRQTHDNIAWELAPDFAPLLARVLATPARVVKESPAKLVTEHDFNGRRFYVKRYRHQAVAGR